MSTPTMDYANQQQAAKAARLFSSAHGELQVHEIGSGNINDTFLVTSQGAPPFILQRLSRQAFDVPEHICENLATLNRLLPADVVASLIGNRRWAIPHLLPTCENRLWWCDANNMWRALSYIDDTVTLTAIENQGQAQEVGRALAIFHILAQRIKPDTLHVTIAHFHETPHYFRLYQHALAANPSCLNTSRAQECFHFIDVHQDSLSTLEDARNRGELHTTTIHGDPKLANILFGRKTSQTCAFIDLDTVGPGLLLYDLGDCLRSCCNRGNSTSDLDTTRFDIDFCLAIMAGYLEQAPHLLSNADKEYLFTAIRLIPLELGLRFFTDYLNGCHYFKTSAPEETLRRAAAQFRLVASIDKQKMLLKEKLAQLLTCA